MGPADSAARLWQAGDRAGAIDAYRRLVAQHPDNPDLARALALALREHGRLDEAVAALDRLMGQGSVRADIARIHGETRHAQALTLIRAGRRAEGVAVLWRVVADHPGDEQAHLNLARLLFAEGQREVPAGLLAGLVAQRPDLPAPALAELAVLLAEAGSPEAAEAASRLALNGEARADKTTPADWWVTLGLALHQQDRLDEALGAYQQALALDPLHVAARCNAAMVDLAHGDLVGGFAGFERRRGDPPALPAPAALAGQRVVLEGEQGHGDTLHFARYAPMVAAAGAEVTLRVQPALVRLLAGMPGVARVVGNDLPSRDAALHLPLASLPLLFGSTLATIPAHVPYVTADRHAVAAWRGRLAALPGIKVGLAWAGDPRRTLSDRAMDARRSMAPATLAPLAELGGFTFVSLQKSAAQTPCDHMTLVDWTSELGDFADTAALVTALDLVITVDTAVVHLAGALGRPVWLLNRLDADWRWLRGRDDSPWYPTLRQFRQTVRGDWADVVRRVAAALEPRRR